VVFYSEQRFNNYPMVGLWPTLLFLFLLLPVTRGFDLNVSYKNYNPRNFCLVGKRPTNSIITTVSLFLFFIRIHRNEQQLWHCDNFCSYVYFSLVIGTSSLDYSRLRKLGYLGGHLTLAFGGPAESIARLEAIYMHCFLIFIRINTLAPIITFTSLSFC